MDPRYVGQKASGLRFAVYARALERERFRVFLERALDRETYVADLWIIGASHVLRLRMPGHSLTEVLACGESALPSDGRLHTIEDLDAGNCEVHVPAALSYKAEVTTTRCTEQGYLDEHARLSSNGHGGRLLYAFPADDGLLAPPLTVIDVLHADDSLLEIRTVHSYPQDRAIVRTHSAIHVSRPR